MLLGPAAARLWQVDQQLAALHAERVVLLHQLRATPAAPSVGGTPVAGPGTPLPRTRWTGQKTLLACGVLLLVVAASVFLAVAWHALGIAGQSAIMVAVTAAAAVASLRCAKSGLRQTAEALAALTGGLLVVDVAAAHARDLAGLGAVSGWTYGAGASVLIGALLGALGYRRAHASAFTVLAVVATGCVPAFVLAAAGPSWPVVAATCVTAAAAAGAAAWSLAGRPATAVTAWTVCVPYLATGVLLALGGAFSAAPAMSWPSIVVLALTAAAAFAVVAVDGTLKRGAPAAMKPAGAVAAVVAALTGPASLVAAAWHARVPGLEVLTAVALLAAVAALWPAGERPRPAQVGAAATAALVTVEAAGLTLAGGAAVRPAAAMLAGVAVTAVVVAARHPSARNAFAWVAAAAAAGSVLLLSATLSTVGATVVLAAAAVAAAGAAASRVRTGQEWPAVAAAVTLGLTSLLPATGVSGQTLAAVFAIGAVSAFTYALLPGRGRAAFGGLGCTYATTFTLLHVAHVTVVEAYTLPLSALLALAGGWRLRRQPDAPSWATTGPAVSVALVPSALVGLAGTAALRPMLTLAAAAVVMLVGARVRWQAPAVTGTAVVAAVGVSQLAPYAIGAPRWLTLGAVGTALLLAGARYEAGRRRVVQAARWVRSLR